MNKRQILTLLALAATAATVWMQPVSAEEPNFSMEAPGKPVVAPAAEETQDIQPAVVQGPRKVIYLFSPEFPTTTLLQNPIPPVKETKFWQLLDKEMRGTSTLALTENMEDADYRVDLRCGGIANCANLYVDVKTMDRDVLASFKLKNIMPYWGLFPLPNYPKLDVVAHDLVTRLDERFRLLEQGGYGATD